MARTKIEWTKNPDGTKGKTWNPITGCTKISPGCTNCYAERMSKRIQAMGHKGYENGFTVTKQDDTVFIQPMRWKKPTRIFVCSMGDLFHDDVNERWIDAIIAVMGLTYDVASTNEENVITGYKQRHTYMVLTKRPDRMREYIQTLIDLDWKTLRNRFYGIAKAACIVYKEKEYLWHSNASMMVATWIKEGMPGLWLGVTAETQEQADQRIPILLQIPAVKRFVSVEPMLGPVGLDFDVQVEHKNGNGYGTSAIQKLDWVICGGESGPGARPMHPYWIYGLRDQCRETGTPFLFKQYGEWSWDLSNYNGPKLGPERVHWIWPDGSHKSVGCGEVSPEKILTYKIGKKRSGRLLDGQEWDEYPEEAKS